MEHKHKHECHPFEVCEDITVKLPITVHAHAHVDHVEFDCKEHCIEKEHDRHKNYEKFTVVQKIQIRIPVRFETECHVHDEDYDFDLHDCHCMD
ncbi:MAG: hypothetical protein LBI27_03665 [Clostridiales bacterium]|jgi:hypothetical protein|nr:hypothetical protein [Clostridiales bacterium]